MIIYTIRKTDIDSEGNKIVINYAEKYQDIWWELHYCQLALLKIFKSFDFNHKEVREGKKQVFVELTNEELEERYKKYEIITMEFKDSEPVDCMKDVFSKLKKHYRRIELDAQKEEVRRLEHRKWQVEQLEAELQKLKSK